MAVFQLVKLLYPRTPAESWLGSAHEGRSSSAQMLDIGLCRADVASSAGLDIPICAGADTSLYPRVE